MINAAGRGGGMGESDWNRQIESHTGGAWARQCVSLPCASCCRSICQQSIWRISNCNIIHLIFNINNCKSLDWDGHGKCIFWKADNSKLLPHVTLRKASAVVCDLFDRAITISVHPPARLSMTAPSSWGCLRSKLITVGVPARRAIYHRNES